jgi:hypothetical protein
MATVRFTAGSILRVLPSSGRVAYAVMLEPRPFMAFYAADAEAETPPDPAQLAKQSPLFVVAVYKSAYSTGGWGTPVGRLPADALPPIPDTFRQDALNPANCVIVDASEENVRKATPQECVGLERNAVWEASHIESRLDDAYAGRPNAFVESLKVKLPSA